MIWFGIASIIIFVLLTIVANARPEWLKKNSWIAAIAISANIGLIAYVATKNFLISIALWMLEMTFIALWRVLRVVGISGDSGNIKALALDNNVLKNSKKALTNGAAILSVISCYTTANGMQDVVFGGWLAYPASIAVQVTLAFLSFFLLRFILAVRDLNWPKVVEKIVCYVLVLVTVGYLIMSSLFSYSFIVTKAYEKTRNENNEAIARTYFTETANLLADENNKRGAALYSILSNAINDADGLSLAIQTQQIVGQEQLNAQIIAALVGVSNMAVNVTIEQETNFGDLSNDELTQSAKDTLVQSNTILKGWVDSLIEALNDLQPIARKDAQALLSDDYSKIKNHYNILYGSSGNSAENALNQIMSTTNQIRSTNGMMRNHIRRTQNAIIDLKPKIDQLRRYLETANDIVIQIENQQSQSTQNNLTSQTVEKIREFCEDLKEYRRYIELKQALENFNETAIKKVYVVVSSEENEKNVGDLSYITEAKWMSVRNENFYTLENSVALLPEYPDMEDSKLTSSSEENAVKISEIPSKAIRIQRILFAELTDVERAINYFGKEYTGYRKMAVFSVVMAVFFDLGAFISGNLVMLIEYFIKESPEDNDIAHSEQDKNQEKEMAQVD